MSGISLSWCRCDREPKIVNDKCEEGNSGGRSLHSGPLIDLYYYIVIKAA